VNLLVLVVDDEPDVEVLFRQQFRRDLRAGRFNTACSRSSGVPRLNALRIAGANAAWGRNYSREFGEWIKRHGFDRMPAATRSVAVELHENAEAITACRNTLPEREGGRRWTRPNFSSQSAMCCIAASYGLSIRTESPPTPDSAVGKRDFASQRQRR
jgi:hypothetical protein